MFTESTEARALVSEKLRMSVGLKLNDDISLNLLFSKDAVPFLGKLEGDDADSAQIEKSLDLMTKLGTTIFAENDNQSDSVMHDYIKPQYFDMSELENVLKNAKRIIS